VWDDPLNPQLAIGDRDGIPRLVVGKAHTHPDSDLQAIGWDKITGKPASYPATAHGHPISDVTGLQSALDSKSNVGHTHDFTAAFAPISHRHPWSQLDSVPSTFPPPVASASTLGGVKVGSGLSIDAQGSLFVSYAYVLPAATGSTLGGVKIGANITIQADGTISVAAPYVHPSGDGLSHVPATGTTNDGAVLKAGATANSSAWGFVAWSEVTGKPSTFSPSAHSHDDTDLTGIAWTKITGKLIASNMQTGLLSAADWATFNGKQAALGYTPVNRAGDTGMTGAFTTTGKMTADSFESTGAGTGIVLKDLTNGNCYKLYVDGGNLKMVQV
jgi:hypothetical protein